MKHSRSAAACCLDLILLAGCESTAATQGTSTNTAATTSRCANGSAASSNTLTVAEEPNSGVDSPQASCWSDITGTPETIADTGTLPSGDSVRFKVAWNASDLYILADVTAWPVYNAADDAAGDWWESDTTEYGVSGLDTHAGPYSSGPTYQFAVAGATGILYTTGDNASHANPLPTAMNHIVQGKGFFTELIVPWQTLDVSKAASGQSYQFDIAQDFGNSAGQRLAQMTWRAIPSDFGTSQGWHVDTADWGTITLG